VNDTRVNKICSLNPDPDCDSHSNSQGGTWPFVMIVNGESVITNFRYCSCSPPPWHLQLPSNLIQVYYN
jgi:hypothetical protein